MIQDVLFIVRLSVHEPPRAKPRRNHDKLRGCQPADSERVNACVGVKGKMVGEGGWDGMAEEVEEEKRSLNPHKKEERTWSFLAAYPGDK